MKPFGILILLSLIFSLPGSVHSQSPDALAPITAANADQVTLLAVLGRGIGGQVLWSPDGETLVIAGSLGVWLLNGDDLAAQPHLLESPTAGVYNMAFSPNSQFLAAGLADRSMVMWDITTGEVTHRVELPSGANVLVFSPDGTILASGHGEYFGGGYWHTQVRLWDATSMALLAVLEAPVQPVEALDFSADGRWLAAAGYDESVRIWRKEHVLSAQDESLLEDIILTGNAPIRFSNRDHLLAYAGLDEQIHVWDVDAETSVYQLLTAMQFRFSTLDFQGDQVIVQQVAPADGGNWVLSRETWNLESMTSERVSATLASSIFSVSHQLQDGTIVSTHDDGALRIWDEQLNLQNSLISFGETIDNISFSTQGDTLLGGDDVYSASETEISYLYRWNVAAALDGEFLPERLAYPNISGRIDFSPDGMQLAVAGMWIPDITILDLKTWQERTIHTPDEYLMDVAFSPDNTLLASAASSGVVRLWDVATRTELLVLRAQPWQASNAIQFSPDGRWLAVGYSADRQSILELWDVETSLETGIGTLFTTLAVGNENLGELPFAFSEDTRQLAMVGYNTIILWDIDTQTQQVVLEDVRQVEALAFNADGSLLAAAIDVDLRPSIGLWDTETGERLLILEGHKNQITALDFTRLGTLLASGSLDGTVRLWGISTSQQ